MQDPHVVSLKYALLAPVGLVYENVPAVDLIHPQFAAQLYGGNLELKMSAHFPSISEARKPVDDFLKSWEMDAHLRGFRIAFSFVNGEVIDRSPAPPGTVFLSGASASCSSASTVRGNITVFPREYPNPPEWKTCSDLVRRMYGRFVAYQEKRESIYTSGYYCLTELQSAALGTVQRKGRPGAALLFKISVDVLNMLGELTSERGGPELARKAGSPEPTPKEAAWLAAAVPTIIRHVANVEGGVYVNELTMSDLPHL